MKSNVLTKKEAKFRAEQLLFAMKKLSQYWARFNDEVDDMLTKGYPFTGDLDDLISDAQRWVDDMDTTYQEDYYLFINGLYIGAFKTRDGAIIRAYELEAPDDVDYLKNSGEDYQAFFDRDVRMNAVIAEVVSESNYRHLQGDNHPANRMELKPDYDKYVDTEFSLGEEYYKGKHRPDRRWNGFAVPYFTLEVVKEIEGNLDELTFEYYDDGSIKITNSDDYAEEVYTPVLFEDVRMWSIGGCNWCWQAKEDEQHTDEIKVITAHSSHGSFTFDAKTGKVLTCNLDDSFNDFPVRVDVVEWRNHYNNKPMPSDVDVLDLGYYTGLGYEQPAHEWRAEFREEQLKEAQGQQAIYAAKFPNGLASWIETHHEIVAGITAAVSLPNHPMRPTNMAEQRVKDRGRAGLYTMAEELTDRFEAGHPDEVWAENDFLETIEAFISMHVFGTAKVS